jgi:hypothetical protein
VGSSPKSRQQKKHPMQPQLFAPPPIAPRRLSGPDATAALALRAYEAVSDAIELFGPRGSLKSVLAYLGGRRRALAVAQGLPHANLYGVFRDAQLDPGFRTLQTHFGPGHAPFEKVVDAYAYLYAQKRGLVRMPQGGILAGSVQAELGRHTLELTQYRCDFSGALARNRRWLHTHWSQVAPILVHAGELFEMALEPIDERIALGHVADLHWWLSHAMPFAFGSMHIAEWLVAYIFRLRGHGGVRFAQDPASLALVAATPGIYREAFAGNLQFIPTRAAPLPMAPIKLFVRDARLGQLALVRRALGHVDVNQAEPTGQTALHVAARQGHSRIVGILLRHGADVHALVPDAAQTPLHLAAREGHVKAAKRLLACGAAVHAADVTGQTPLHVALSSEHEPLTKLLLPFGAPLAVANAQGELPLHIAARLASPGMLKRVLKTYRRHTLQPLFEVANKAGETALSVAALANRPDVTQLLLSWSAPPPTTCLADDSLHPALAALSMDILHTGADLHLFGLLVRCQARHLKQVVAVLRAALLAGVAKAERPALAELIDASVTAGR